MVQNILPVKRPIQSDTRQRLRAVRKVGRHYRLWLSVGVAAISLLVLLAPAQVQGTDACWSHNETRFQHMSRSGHTGEAYGGDADVPEQWNGAYRIQGEPFGSRLLQVGEGLWEELKVKSRSGIINCEQDRAHELFISVCTEGIQISALRGIHGSPYDFAASPSKPMSTVDPKHGVLCKSGPDDVSSRNCGNTVRDSKSPFADKGRVASYQKDALTRNLALEDAYGPYYLVTYNPTGRNRQSVVDAGFFVRY